MEQLNLNKLYKHLEYSDEELEANRDLLLHSVQEQPVEEPLKPSASAKLTESLNVAKFRFAWPSRVTLVSSLAASALTAIAAILLFAPNPLDNSSLAEIQRFVASNGDSEELYSLAEDMKTSNSETTRLNGLLVSTLLGTDGVNRLAGAQGLVEDPRDEFRIFYLEYLLENAANDHYNVEYIESLMDRENNMECLYLLGRLLRIAQQNEGTAYI